MGISVLFSGGKDSTRTVHWCLENKIPVDYLVTLIPKRHDSWMFHYPNIHLAELSAKAIGIEHVSKATSGIKEKEIEDMKTLLKKLNISGLACGGIASSYQKSRIEKVCDELNLDFITPFWGVDPEKFMRDIINLRFDVRIIGVYSMGFDKNWLGRKLDEQTLLDLIELNKKYDVNLVGEGGEFESICLDGPVFKERIEILESEIVWDNKTNSGYMNIIKAKLSPKI